MRMAGWWSAASCSTPKDELDPSSKPTLDQIGTLLKQRPALRLHVVGHTDNIGALAGNREISKRRAHAICVALVSEYGISRATA